MKKLFKLLPVSLLALTVSACAECPKMADYDKTPYSREGTAGHGVAIYGNKCHAKPMKQPAATAEPVFHERVKK